MTKIGLKRKTVRLENYSTAWAKQFEKEQSKIQKVIGEKVVIEHIGSTAIKGLPAKPVIDIVVGFPFLRDAKQSLKKLEKAGYILTPHFRRPHQHILFVKGRGNHRTHHIHVIRYKGVVWKRLTIFRDYLNTHPARAKQYANLKMKLAKLYADDRKSYTRAKALFVKETVEIASKK